MSYQKWSEKLKSDKKNLQHDDLEVLALEVLDSTKGEIIESKINNLYQITLNMLYINLGVPVSPRQSSVAILKGNDISYIHSSLKSILTKY